MQKYGFYGIDTFIHGTRPIRQFWTQMLSFTKVSFGPRPNQNAVQSKHIEFFIISMQKCIISIKHINACTHSIETVHALFFPVLSAKVTIKKLQHQNHAKGHDATLWQDSKRAPTDLDTRDAFSTFPHSQTVFSNISLMLNLKKKKTFKNLVKF